jgi:transcriptional regulator with XRE-family HTH domain
MTKLELSDERLGERMDVARQTVYRWRTQQNRLNPGKIAAIADALGRAAEDLYRPPERPSVDAMLKTATPEQIADTIAFVERFVLKN